MWYKSVFALSKAHFSLKWKDTWQNYSLLWSLHMGVVEIRISWIMKNFVLRMHQKWHNFPQKSVFLSSNGKYQTCAHQTFSEDFLGPYLLEKRHLVGIQRLFIFSYFGDSLFLACGINLFFPCQKPIFHWNEKILGRITRYYDLFTWV